MIYSELFCLFVAAAVPCPHGLAVTGSGPQRSNAPEHEGAAADLHASRSRSLATQFVHEGAGQANGACLARKQDLVFQLNEIANLRAEERHSAAERLASLRAELQQQEKAVAQAASEIKEAERVAAYQRTKIGELKTSLVARLLAERRNSSILFSNLEAELASYKNA
eukprot:CAMPEP_0171078388 /NCGR_PEP_ID=MMETSP0766_2-20121228/14613_1 /TAXON_ID=439317 /ORGANISM="Gambierdiscus australes, Strain CAWD 149" /LENGTH=166 /DNA_ID=CAMNT_0011535513 /DNA_START=70 /DNA_END=570 /DNA_ORIENTATION=-